jgi:predicted TIM-barrel fold metal-dependent hydrolase
MDFRATGISFQKASSPEGRNTNFLNEIGPERIIFGSDIPFGTMKRELNKILYLAAGDREKEMMLSENIKRLTSVAEGAIDKRTGRRRNST